MKDKPAVNFLLTTLIGGLIFLVPVGMLGFILFKVLAVMTLIAQPLADWLPVDTVGGVALANLIHLLNPEAIVITGGLTGAWDILVEEARRETSKRVLKGLMENIVFMRSTLCIEDAGTVGAAAVVFDGLDKN